MGLFYVPEVLTKLHFKIIKNNYQQLIIKQLQKASMASNSATLRIKAAVVGIKLQMFRDHADKKDTGSITVFYY